MIKYNRVFAVLLLVAMLLGVLSACNNGDEGNGSQQPVANGSSIADESTVSEDEALSKFNALESNTDKLFYNASGAYPGANEVVKLGSVDFGMLSDLREAIENNQNVYSEVSMQFDKLIVDNQDLLKQLGDRGLGLSANVLTNGEDINMNMKGSLQGVDISADMILDDNGLVFDFPLMLKKPLYIDMDFLMQAFSSEKPVTGGTFMSYGANDTLVYDQDYANEVEDEVGAALVFELIANLPELGEKIENWAKQKLTKDSLEHIEGLIKELIPERCITTATVTVPELKGAYITTDTEAECVTLKIDIPALHEILSAVDSKLLTDTVVKDIIVSLVDDMIDTKLFSLLAFDASQISGEKLYEELCNGLKDLLSTYDENDIPDETLIINRYFVNGRNAKTDVVLDVGDEEGFECSFWDVYKDNARQYGFKMVVDGETLFDVAGGADTNEASMDAKLANVLTVIIKRDAESFSVDCVLESDGSKIELAWGETDTNDMFKFALTEGSEKLLDISCTSKNSLNKKDWTVKAVIDDGEDDVEINGTVSVTETKGDDSYGATVSVALNSDGIMDMAFSYSLSYDFNSDKVLEKADPNGAYVVDDEKDLNGLDSILTDAAKNGTVNKEVAI